MTKIIYMDDTIRMMNMEYVESLVRIKKGEVKQTESGYKYLLIIDKDEE